MHGCEGTVSHDVTVWPKPIAKVRAYAKDDPDQKRQSGCPDLEVVVANESRGKNLTYTYDLGDGQTANQTTLAPIDHTYYNTLDEDKPYVISLTAESDKGCKDEDKTTVTVFPGLDVDFEYSQTDASGNKTGKKEGCSPFDVLFESKAVGAHEFYWDFGDGEPGAEIKPSGEAVRFHRYVNREITDQTYNVKLKAKNSKGCWAESEVKKVTVYATPVPEFTLDPYKQTWPNNEVRIVNTTDPMSSKWEFDWTYGDGNVSKGQTPTSTPYVYEQWALRDWDYAYTITLSAFNTEHPECKGTMTDYAYIMPPIPTPSFTALRSEACAPFQVVLQNTTEYKKDMEFEWDFGDDGDKSTEPDPVHTYYEPGIYQVTLTARGEGGHATAYGVYVAHGKPLVKFEMAPKQVMLPKARVKAQNGSTDWDGSPLGEGTKYFWDFGDGTTSEEVSPVKEYERAGEFDVSLHVESAMGCADELRIEKAVTVLPAGWIKFPNVFSPPLSGMNDGYYGDLSPEDFCTIFYPDYRGVSDYHLMIFDRWGSLVFETRDIKRGWDGTRKRKVMGGGCAMGVYAWRATGHYFNGTVFDKRGNVTLLR
ncbi:MAG: hypothetical protein CSA97_03670 [Bacteroidetes bacterium]|nr:MAG: hypothetical protein CSA97_03670 [Bacteroidota bacterium]